MGPYRGCVVGDWCGGACGSLYLGTWLGLCTQALDLVEKEGEVRDIFPAVLQTFGLRSEV